ncbi:MAG: imidazole glycerol phosphate synthase subunit HisH [Methanobacteriota archaeon]|nr:MAG: imidazole glycerol phosphate synthase subunit HisH [Euryarchaeota archaeon]
MKVTVVDYGVGNLHSISKGLERAGAKIQVSSSPQEIAGAESIVFPGVGAFGAAMESLRPEASSLREAILGETPTLGICLGMQILFETSEESPGEGLSVLKGSVRRLKAPRVPHMGWNNVSCSSDDLFEGIGADAQFYFANSFICSPTEKVTISETVYGERFPAAVRKGTVVGVQFHPEKSGEPGLKLLANFIRISEGSA